jgi:exodeoxyribonuclease VII large subunit
MVLAQNDAEIGYNPSALLNIFSSTLNNESTRRVVRVKGIYIAGKGTSYNGFYYDSLKDENSDASMTLVIPGIIRAQLNQNELIECHAYLIKKVQLNGGRIDLQLNVVELLSRSASSYSESQLKAFEILKKKAEAGYKDVDGFIKRKIIREEPITINILIGKAGIVDNDIKHQLQEAIGFYKFYFIRVNLALEKEIIESLNYYQKKCDIIAISRGGGENLEIFDNPGISETALSLSTHFITAIGHNDNSPLLQKVADKAFITPTALGQYFKEIYNNTIGELQNSKAKLVDDITKQLDANYSKQIRSMELSMQSLQKQNERDTDALIRQLQEAREQKESYTAQVAELQKQLEKSGKVNVSTILLFIAALLIGWLLGQLITP